MDEATLVQTMTMGKRGGTMGNTGGSGMGETGGTGGSGMGGSRGMGGTGLRGIEEEEDAPKAWDNDEGGDVDDEREVGGIANDHGIQGF